MSGRISSRYGALVAALGAALWGMGNSALAAPRDVAGWLLANQPRAHKTYAPDANFSFNSFGRKNLVTPLGKGLYQIDFRSLFNGGGHNNVQVSAVATNGYCISAGWDAKGGDNSARLWVACFNEQGLPASTAFTVLYQSRRLAIGDAAHRVAFLLADQPSNPGYTPNITYNYNSGGSPNTIARSAAGTYTVTLPGLVVRGGDVQVTAYADHNAPVPARCNVGPSRWTAGPAGTTIDVRCFDRTGAPADEFFSLAYAVNMPFSLVNGGSSVGAYAWTNKQKLATPYTPRVPWNFDSAGSDLMQSELVQRGFYQVSSPASVTFGPSLVLLTAVQNATAPANVYCNVRSWFPIVSQCFRQGGRLIDSQFDVTQEAIPSDLLPRRRKP